METESIFFTEDTAENALFEAGLSDFYLGDISSSMPDDDDEDDEDSDDEDDDKGNDSNDDDPPLDKDVVHSPVTTLPGGVPKKS